MTKTKEVESGKRLKKLENHLDIHNLSNIKLSDLDDDTFYLIEKYVGYYKPQKKSGLFILKIDKVVDDMIGIGIIDI